MRAMQTLYVSYNTARSNLIDGWICIAISAVVVCVFALHNTASISHGLSCGGCGYGGGDIGVISFDCVCVNWQVRVVQAHSAVSAVAMSMLSTSNNSSSSNCMFLPNAMEHV